MWIDHTPRTQRETHVQYSVNPQPMVLADHLVPSRTWLTDLGLIVAGSAVVAALAQIAIPTWPVPITGQTLGVILVGAILGSRRGAAAMLLYLLEGIAGLPVFAEFSGGPAMITKPSFGFIIGFVFAAYAMGWFSERRWDQHPWKGFVGFSIASVIPFLFGVPYMAWMLARMGYAHDLATVIDLGVTPFIVGGVIKAGIAAIALPILWKRFRA